MNETYRYYNIVLLWIVKTIVFIWKDILFIEIGKSDIRWVRTATTAHNNHKYRNAILKIHTKKSNKKKIRFKI